MQLENQVVSLDLAKRLKELGVKQESLFWWVEIEEEPKHAEIVFDLDKASFPTAKFYSAFTVAELGEMLPTEVELESKLTGNKEKKGIGFLTDDIVEQVNDFYGVDKYRLFILECGKYQVKEKTEADARAKMLICLLESQLIKQQ